MAVQPPKFKRLRCQYSTNCVPVHATGAVDQRVEGPEPGLVGDVQDAALR